MIPGGMQQRQEAENDSVTTLVPWSAETMTVMTKTLFIIIIIIIIVALTSPTDLGICM